MPDPRLAQHLPSLAVKLWDPLALREFSSLLRDPVFRGRGVPHGDGRPVLLVPGFLSGDWSMRILQGWLDRIGYKAYLSGIFFNIPHSERMLAGLRHRLVQVDAEAGARGSVVGHSRGGLLANVPSQLRANSVAPALTNACPLAHPP